MISPFNVRRSSCRICLNIDSRKIHSKILIRILQLVVLTFIHSQLIGIDLQCIICSLSSLIINQTFAERLVVYSGWNCRSFYRYIIHRPAGGIRESVFCFSTRIKNRLGSSQGRKLLFIYDKVIGKPILQSILTLAILVSIPFIDSEG